MWLFTTDCNFSVVTSHHSKKVLLVRSRFPGHIEKAFPKAVVEKTPERDYLYRALVSKKTFNEWFLKYVETMNYNNFKNTLIEPKYESLCHDVWETCFVDQCRRGYGVLRKKVKSIMFDPFTKNLTHSSKTGYNYNNSK
jgi:hypothetical protein